MKFVTVTERETSDPSTTAESEGQIDAVPLDTLNVTPDLAGVALRMAGHMLRLQGNSPVNLRQIADCAVDLLRTFDESAKRKRVVICNCLSCIGTGYHRFRSR